MSATPVERLNAALAGRYRIERELGQGGMATVYLADDLRHERKVALKVLKPELAAVVGAERFLAEIKTTANLQHPNILPLFDSGAADTYLFYVMPYVAGESLRARLDRESQLPVEEAVRIASDVAEALDYAHGLGVIHRDIKPANILLQAGKPVIADFGIALALGAAGGHRLTETGLSLGTPHYMSPEQATGDLAVGTATDIYAVACVLYEMLVGEPPFTGSTPQAILGKIIQSRWISATEARPTVPAHVDAAIRKALERVPADRFMGALEFSRALVDDGFLYGAVSKASGRGGWNWPAVSGWLTVALLVLALGVSIQRTAPEVSVSRQVLSTEAWVAEDAPSFGEYAALAPDGSSMILPLAGQLGLKLRNATDIVPIPGTAGARNAVYSPDGEWIAYVVGQELFKRTLLGGSSIRLAGSLEPPPQRAGIAWLDDGTIAYERQEPLRRGLVLIDEGGGEPLVVFDTPGPALTWMHALPGARWLLVVTVGAELHVIDLRDGSAELILDDVVRAWYTPTGHLVYVRPDGGVFAMPFDVNALESDGSVTPLFDGVRTSDGSADMHLARDGTLLYVEGLGVPERQLSVVDLEGNERVLPLAPRRLPDQGVGWSPDGRTVAFVSSDQIYTYDVVLNTPPRQITAGGSNGLPVFSPDGTRIAFSAVRGQEADLFVKDLNDPAEPRLLVSLDGIELMMQWPTDSVIVFEKEIARTDLWWLDLSNPDNPEARPYLRSEGVLAAISVSPDGTLAAYRSDESGTDEIYIRSFPIPGEQTVISQGGGHAPFWSPDGRTLYYATGGGGVATRSTIPRYRTFMAVHLQREPVLSVLATDSLFSITSSAPFPGSALHPDGDRFILVRPVASEAGPRLILVQSFFEELERLVPN